MNGLELLQKLALHQALALRGNDTIEIQKLSSVAISTSLDNVVSMITTIFLNGANPIRVPEYFSLESILLKSEKYFPTIFLLCKHHNYLYPGYWGIVK